MQSDGFLIFIRYINFVPHPQVSVFVVSKTHNWVKCNLADRNVIFPDYDKRQAQYNTVLYFATVEHEDHKDH